MESRSGGKSREPVTGFRLTRREKVALAMQPHRLMQQSQPLRYAGASKQRYEIRHGVLSEVRIFEENP